MVTSATRIHSLISLRELGYSTHFPDTNFRDGHRTTPNFGRNIYIVRRRCSLNVLSVWYIASFRNWSASKAKTRRPNFALFDPAVKIGREVDELPESKRISIIVVQGKSFRFSISCSVFTALHRMQTRSSDNNSVCPSVRLSNCEL